MFLNNGFEDQKHLPGVFERQVFGKRASVSVLVSTPCCRVLMIGAIAGCFKNAGQINFHLRCHDALQKVGLTANLQTFLADISSRYKTTVKMKQSQTQTQRGSDGPAAAAQTVSSICFKSSML